MYYTIQNNSPIEASLPNTSNPQIFIAAQSQEWRHERGIFAIVERRADVTECYSDTATDTIYAPLEPVVIATPQPFDLSKIKLGRAFRALGQEEAFEAYLDSDPTLRRDWERAVTLRSDDPLVVSSCYVFKSTLGLTDEQMTAMLDSCRSG